MAKGHKFSDIGVGDHVLIVNPARPYSRRPEPSQYRSGRIVMLGPHGWVLNLGGPHGTPAVCTAKNFIKLTRKASRS